MAFSDYILQNAIFKGFPIGKSKGYQIGLEDSLFHGIVDMIKVCRTLNLSLEETKEQIIMRYQISEPEANKYIRNFWQSCAERS